MIIDMPLYRRMLMWALRIPSPSKATMLAAERRLRERRLLEQGWTLHYAPLDVRPEDGLLTLREAWTGRASDGP